MWYIYMHMEEEKKTPKRLIINVDENLHKKIKILATRRNMSIKQYVLESVVFRMQQDREK